MAPATIGESSYAKNAVKYIEILNKLRSIGAQSAVDLPTVVFCGNQSAGKSSLLEAISGIQLPRSDGTCTRCVMEIRLIQSSSDWSCQVSLRKEYDAHEKKLIRPEESKFGDIINDPDNVEIVARRAQKALLNPYSSPEDYFNHDFENINYVDDAVDNELKFTKNVVCLEIKGPKVPNLSLIDLPGIIRHVENVEDERFIKLIEELVEDYISKEQSIVVATISCKDEIDNQAIVTLAKKADKQGLRTLGVLTKPDTIEEGTHDNWIKIVRGDAHSLALGYYVVRNPKPKELKDGITFDKARKNEMRFFEEEEPWRSFHLRDRLGVNHLQKKLSDLLIHAIKRTLPSIRKEIEDKLENIHDELKQIPEQLGENPRIELFRMTKKCADSIREEVTCSNDQTDLWQEINKGLKNFKYNLCSTRPIFEIGGQRFDILQEFIKSTNEFDDKDDELLIISETYVADIVNKARGRLLPGFTPYSAVVSLIKMLQKKWKTPALDCLHEINEIMAQHVNDSTDNIFSRFPSLIGRMKFNAMTFLEECKQNTEKYIDFINEVEGGDFPFTLDEGSMIVLKNEYFNKFHEASTPHMDDNQKPLDTLEIMASAMAYFKLAFKRYADIVSMTIIHAFIDNFSKVIEEKFLEACDPMEGEEDFELDELIKEDENISGRRNSLLETEKHLRSMLASLIRFGY
ncbi:P-loop containing nucleoside triphosphate hydrolase protein [Glomus cerebriforme]|uniref:P-loop containing nucleoside triphosphate hydrolase protein n=1 Tax=Glomus cerebriforme TaxID=658196 RepID=A0A397TC65_9GLOM|nr:P-loop containing nucleoside triphosphate hydrolase protein [Glomus cerebriforme]